MSRPATDPSKKTTACVVRSKSRPPPKKRIAAVAMASPPSTKAPMTAGLAATITVLLLRGVLPPRIFGALAFHERTHRRVVASVTEGSGRSVGDRGACPGIQEDAVVADGDQARQFVTDHDDGGDRKSTRLNSSH